MFGCAHRGRSTFGPIRARRQEMVFDAHARAFGFFGGVPPRGIYDNMKTAVDAVFVGKARAFNRRFLINGATTTWSSRPPARRRRAGRRARSSTRCSTVRGRLFKPRLRFASLEELNGWLEAECLRWARAATVIRSSEDCTVAQAWEAGAAGAAADAGAVRRLPRDRARGDRRPAW